MVQVRPFQVGELPFLGGAAPLLEFRETTHLDVAYLGGSARGFHQNGLHQRFSAGARHDPQPGPPAHRMRPARVRQADRGSNPGRKPKDGPLVSNQVGQKKPNQEKVGVPVAERSSVAHRQGGRSSVRARWCGRCRAHQLRSSGRRSGQSGAADLRSRVLDRGDDAHGDRHSYESPILIRSSRGERDAAGRKPVASLARGEGRKGAIHADSHMIEQCAWWLID